MIWKTDTHEFAATICQRTGKTCPALARMARAIAQAMATAQAATSPDFQVEGSSELAHCEHGCTARFDARSERIRVYCGAAADSPSDCLETYADMLFDDQSDALPAQVISDRPCAMLQATAIMPVVRAEREFRATA
ncbi:hypothetical protein [Ruegeria arenilitoris]|uniref:hypothetical protein n=1 Tax=Ruegeria arenilitoris TaxID=1173585 RepID=UPI00147AD04A|nr:hypothetical protein [Ruegeria arenilitoris]